MRPSVLVIAAIVGLTATSLGIIAATYAPADSDSQAPLLESQGTPNLATTPIAGELAIQSIGDSGQDEIVVSKCEVVTGVPCINPIRPARAEPPTCPSAKDIPGFGNTCVDDEGLWIVEGIDQPVAPPHHGIAGADENVSMFRAGEEFGDNPWGTKDVECVDSTQPHRTIAVYVIPKGAPDRIEEWRSFIEFALEMSNHFIDYEGRTEGQPMTLRVECDGNGDIKIYTVETAVTVDKLTFGEITKAVRALNPTADQRFQYWTWTDLFDNYGYDWDATRGYGYAKGVYEVTYDDQTWYTCCNFDKIPVLESCGCAGLATTPSATELADLNGNSPCTSCSAPVGNVWVGKGRPIGQSQTTNELRLYETWYGATTTLHEGLHTMGAVAKAAPNNDGGAHCIDGPDIMCYPDEDDEPYFPFLGDDYSGYYYSTACDGRSFVDCGHDDYFDPNPDPNTYIGKNWNIGGPENKFITKGTKFAVDATANDDYYAIRSDKISGSFAMQVLGNDYSSDPATLKIIGVTQPSKGSVTINGKNIDYTPNIADLGSTTFSYSIEDGAGKQDTATVWIDLEHSPVMTPIDEEVLEDSGVHSFTITNHCYDDDLQYDIDDLAEVTWDSISKSGPKAKFGSPPAGFENFKSESSNCPTMPPTRPHQGKDWAGYLLEFGEPSQWITKVDPPENFYGNFQGSVYYKDIHYRRDYPTNGDFDAGCCEYWRLRSDFNYDVLPVNDAPIALPKTATGPEDTTVQFDLNIYDIDGQPHSNVHPASSYPLGYASPTYDNGKRYFGELEIRMPRITSLGTVTLQYVDGNDALAITKAFINSTGYGTTGEIQFTFEPNTNECGTVKIPYTVSDYEFTVASTIEITISCINDPPTFTTSIPTGGIRRIEDSGVHSVADFVTNIVPGPGNENSQVVTVSAIETSTTNTQLFASVPTLIPNGQNYDLQFTPATNECGIAKFRIEGTDDGSPPETTQSDEFPIIIACINDAPNAVDDSITATEDTNLAIDVLANDDNLIDDNDDDGNDANGINHAPESLSITWVGTDVLDPATQGQTSLGGTVAINAGVVSYTPPSDHCGTVADQFQYVASDDGLTKGTNKLTDWAQVTITIACVNDAPSFTLSHSETNPLTVDEDSDAHVLTNFAFDGKPGPSNEAGQNLVWNIAAISTTNVELFSALPSLTGLDPESADLEFAVTPNECGLATYEISASDDGTPSQSTSARFAIAVTCLNDKPFGEFISTTTSEDVALTFPLPTASSHGGDIDDDDGNAANGHNDNAELLSITRLSATIFDPPAQGETLEGGSLSYNAATGELTYTPRQDYCHDTVPDSFWYAITDDGLGTGKATLTSEYQAEITVICFNDPPRMEFENDELAIDEDSGKKTYHIFKQLTPGPSDESHQSITLSVATAQTSNTQLFASTPRFVEIAGKQRLELDLVDNECGLAVLEITATDDGIPAESTSKELPVKIRCLNDPPAAVTDYLSLAEDTFASIGPIANDHGGVDDTDDDDDTSNGANGDDGSPRPSELLSLLRFGHYKSGIWHGGTSAAGALLTGEGASITYTPAPDYCNTGGNADFVEYVVQDNDLGTGSSPLSSIGRIEVEVVCINDSPSFTLELGPNATAISDEDAGPVTHEQITKDARPGPANEASQGLGWLLELQTITNTQLFVTPPQIVVYNASTIHLQYEAASDECGVATYTLNATDTGNPARIATSPLAVQVRCVNDPPVAADLTIKWTEDVVGNIDVLALAGLGVDQNDDDNDTTNGINHPTEVLAIGLSGAFDGVSWTVGETAKGGRIEAIGGVLNYTPARDYCASSSVDVDTIHYQIVDDGLGGLLEPATDIGTIFVEVACVNDAPHGGIDRYSGAEDQVIARDASSGVLANDWDVEDHPIRAKLLQDVRYGTLELNADGSFEYTPNANFHGRDTFTYEVIDILGAKTNVRVYLDIYPVPDPPIGVPDYYQVRPDQTTRILPEKTVLENDINVDGDGLVAHLLQTTQHGILEFKQDGSFTYTPDTGFLGTDFFVYRATNPNMAAASGTKVHIRIKEFQPPSADFAFNSIPTGPGGLVAFKDKSVAFDEYGLAPEDGTTPELRGIQGWLWEFGDGTTSRAQEPTHTYDYPGRFAVKLTVWDARGAKDTMVKEIQIGTPPIRTTAPEFGEIKMPTEVFEGTFVPFTFAANVRQEFSVQWYQISGPPIKFERRSASLGFIAPYLEYADEVIEIEMLAIPWADAKQGQFERITMTVIPALDRPTISFGNNFTVAAGDEFTLQALVRNAPIGGEISLRQISGPSLGLGTVNQPLAHVVAPNDAAGTELVFEGIISNGTQGARTTFAVQVTEAASTEPPKSNDLTVASTSEDEDGTPTMYYVVGAVMATMFVGLVSGLAFAARRR